MAAAIPRLRDWLPAASVAAVIAVIAVGLGTIATGGSLGTPTPPFTITWQPRIDPAVWITLVAVLAAVAGVPRYLLRMRSPWAVAAALHLTAAGLGLAMNLGHDGVRGWWEMFATGAHGSFEGRFEYLLGRPLLDRGVGYYLGHFAALYPEMTTHIKGNPPGPLILMRLAGVSDAGGLAALCVAVGSIAAPGAYALGRTLGGEPRGRVAGLLCAGSPAVLLFGVSSFDDVFAGVGTLAAWLLVRGATERRRRRWGWLATGAAVAALGTFLSWLLFAVPAWAAVVALRRSDWRNALRVAGACALGIAALNGGLALAYGYDPFAALRAVTGAYAHGAAAGRPYAFWLFGSPAAWLAMLGLPIGWLSLRALGDGDAAAVALWLLILAAAVIGVTKAETERIWLPFVPLACVAAAAALPASPRRLRGMLALLLGQALLVELLFFTIW